MIEPVLKECALVESWSGAGGSDGKSLNFFDPQRKTWRQVWVSDLGNILDYRQGEYRDGASAKCSRPPPMAAGAGTRPGSGST